MRVYVRIMRDAGTMPEDRGIEGTEEEVEDGILHWANAYGIVHVLDERTGNIVRTITPADAAMKLMARGDEAWKPGHGSTLPD